MLKSRVIAFLLILLGIALLITVCNVAAYGWINTHFVTPTPYPF
jgi:nitrate reductase NapE component